MDKRPSTLFIMLGGVAALAALPNIAAAETDTHTAAPFAMPDLVTSRLLGVELGFANVNLQDDDAPIHILNLDLAGQLELVSGVFVFGRLPTTYIHFSDSGASESDLGNLLLGLGVVTGPSELRYGASFAVGLPTAPGRAIEGNDGTGAYHAGIARFDVFSRYKANTTTFDLQTHIRLDRPRYFVQGQLGYQRSDSGVGDALDLLRLGVSAGYKASDRLAVIGEFTNISAHLEEDAVERGTEDDLFHWLRGGVRYNLGRTTIGGHFYTALGTPGVFEELDVFGVVVDVSARM